MKDLNEVFEKAKAMLENVTLTGEDEKTISTEGMIATRIDRYSHNISLQDGRIAQVRIVIEADSEKFMEDGEETITLTAKEKC